MRLEIGDKCNLVVVYTRLGHSPRVSILLPFSINHYIYTTKQ